ncbi:MAG: hypothetical protein ACHQZQ_02245 [SAR324 cluster bacterium]
MPLTEELKTAQDLREAGLPQKAAEVLAAKLEATAQAARDSVFRDFRGEINGRFDALHAEISTLISGLRAELAGNKAEISTSISGLRAVIAGNKADGEKSLRQVQGVLLTAILGAGSIVVAVLVALKLW